MDVKQLRPGLWRWTAAHPEWKPEKDKPGGWGQMVGCVLYEPGAGAEPSGVVLIDPLAPPDDSPEAAGFWEALDQDVRRQALPVAILLGNHYHERSAGRILERYRERPGASIWAHESMRGKVRCPITDTFTGDGSVLPGGIRAHRVAGMEDDEVAFHVPAHGALTFSDALIGAGAGRVRVAPLSWAPDTPEAARAYESEFRASLRRLLDLPIEMLLVSHGPPILEGGRAALEEALGAPAWGD